MSGNDSANSSERKTLKQVARIRRDHESDLRWYFEFGIRQFEQASNLQAQIERLRLFGELARPCNKCGGNTEKNIPGSGFVTDSQEFRDYVKLVGLLAVPLDVQAWLEKHNPPGLGAQQRDNRGRFTEERGEQIDGGMTCPRCNGKGWVSGAKNRSKGPLTAKPTRSSVQGNGVPETGGSESMARLGLISRRLEAVRRLDPLAGAALEAFYAPSGGSSACLWHLTPAGRTMLRENSQRLPERAYFENLRDAQERNPNEKRRRQFDAATEQAAMVEERMRSAWCQAVGGV